MAPRPRIALSGGDRRQRVEARAALGNLRNLLFATRTVKRYTAALERFKAWLAASQFDPWSFADMDDAVCEFIEQLWGQGEPQN